MNRKVLVVSNNSFSKTTNNGKTLESIFYSFEKHNISQVYFTDRISPDFDYCDNYFKISDSEVLKGIFKGTGIVGRIMGKQLFTAGINPSNEIIDDLANFSTKKSFLRFCRDILWATNTWKNAALNNWSLQQKPDFIFFVTGASDFSHKVALYLSELLKVPLVSYFTDDYLIYPLKRNLFDFIQRYRMKKFYQATVERSSLCFAISDLMSEEYTSYFRKTFYPIMNAVDNKKYLKKESGQNEIVINYFGSIHTNRWKMIVRLANILKLPERKNLILNVYVTTKPGNNILRFFSDTGVNYKGGVTGDELNRTLMQSDILLHVESDDIYSKSLTRLSVSTKLPEYLISGRPVLGFGPRDVASMKLLIQNNIGVVISPSDDPYTIDNQLEKLLNDSSFRDNLGKIGYEYASVHYDKIRITQEFDTKINQILPEKPLGITNTGR